jgi:antitoxin component YwqK of YwqJK toxin-antitoxin module
MKLNLQWSATILLVLGGVFFSLCIASSKTSSNQRENVSVEKNKRNPGELKSPQDVMNGKRVSWYKNGNKQSEATFINGKENGSIIIWYESGQKSSQTLMKDGKPDGLFISWYENGQKELEGHAVNGQYHGLWESWYENGVKSSEMLFNNGDVQECSYFDEKGKIIHKNETDVSVCQSVYKLIFLKQMGQL